MRGLVRFVMLAVTGAITLMPVGPAHAATIGVSTTVDEWGVGQACGLREAIRAAELNIAYGGCRAGAPGHDRITVPPGTYLLDVPQDTIDEASGDLDIKSEVTIVGAGPNATIVDGRNDSGVISVDGTESTLEGLTLRNGRTFTGGGLHVDASVVVLRRSHVMGNEATMSLGGGVYATQSEVTIVDSTISGNEALAHGGGLYITNTAVTLDRVTVSGNFLTGTGGDGGGIHTSGSTLTAINTTISGNESGNHGGGIYVATTDVTLRNATVTANVADEEADNSGDGGGIEVASGTVSLSNTILAANEDRTQAVGEGRDCSGTLDSEGYNLVGYDGDCTITPAPGDQIGTAFPDDPIDPQLAPLSDNGGPTETHAVLPGSPAFDRGNPASPGSSTSACSDTDQRDVPRPQGGRCDIGAYEVGMCLGVLINRVGYEGAGTILGTDQDDGILGHGGRDTIKAGGGDDAICAGAGNDRASGGAGNDRVLGERGNDRLRGQGGKDTLKGQQGKDKLGGGGGRDRLIGGPKTDRCNGGGGKDSGTSCADESKIP